MLIATLNQLLRKFHGMSKIQPTFQIELVRDNSYLVSLDVKSLYTNILNTEGTKSVKASLESYSKRTTYFQLQKPHTDKRLRHESNLRTLITKPRY